MVEKVEKSVFGLQLLLRQERPAVSGCAKGSTQLIQSEQTQPTSSLHQAANLCSIITVCSVYEVKPQRARGCSALTLMMSLANQKEAECTGHTGFTACAGGNTAGHSLRCVCRGRVLCVCVCHVRFQSDDSLMGNLESVCSLM